MRLGQFLHPECFIFDLQETNWEMVLRRIVHVVAQKGLITNEAPVVAKLMEREKFMTTAIGNRIAIPHCLTDEVPVLVVTVTCSRAGIDFHAFDGIPVHAVVLFLGKTGDDWSHFVALARFARLIRDTPFIDQLLSSVCVEDMVRAFEWEDKID
jgi:mannitol/fructose-specific phosphotransferase system IIA component (Ntr-type)